ncbi:hypothetical protein A2415_01740 [candidate division WWE3 bacterium RIFOXYC1_FULL_39_7]|uniref:Uncharacterized protein n=1 Tax=candidate division WWE3 bacterium RIFOXYC1_FULL_39_7 TaxID=1802643 RepID=A0A1F4WI78_UNCKA|nr:MAG: hypothetical protein A2415_01740 [candidate division WWE3 bacterium RIFOXYC1_FULL_39_7]
MSYTRVAPMIYKESGEKLDFSRENQSLKCDTSKKNIFFQIDLTGFVAGGSIMGFGQFHRD